MKSIIKYNSTDGKWELIDQEAGSTPISTAVGSPYANPWDLKWSADIGISCGDTVDATAIASDIAKGKTAYVNGEKIVGTKEDASISVDGLTAQVGDVLAGVTFIGADGTQQEGTIVVTPQKSVSFNDLTNNGGTVTVAVGGYVDEVVITGITMPEASQIAYNQTVLGVTGTFTYGATATASDIMQGKTAYINGDMVTGTRTEATGGSGVPDNEYGVALVVEFSSPAGVPDGVVGQTISLQPYNYSDTSSPATRVWQGSVYNSQGAVVYHTIYYAGSSSAWVYTVGSSSENYTSNTAFAEYFTSDLMSDPWSEDGTMWGMYPPAVLSISVHVAELYYIQSSLGIEGQ